MVGCGLKCLLYICSLTVSERGTGGGGAGWPGAAQGRVESGAHLGLPWGTRHFCLALAGLMREKAALIDFFLLPDATCWERGA